jgi:hypothetical protein
MTVEDKKNCVRFQVLTATSVMMTVFKDVAPCSLVEIDRRFRGAYCLSLQDDDDGDSKHLLNVGQFIMEAVSTSETSVNF